jgi:hypothetical protein
LSCISTNNNILVLVALSSYLVPITESSLALFDILKRDPSPTCNISLRLFVPIPTLPSLLKLITLNSSSYLLFDNTISILLLEFTLEFSYLHNLNVALAPYHTPPTSLLFSRK